LRLFIVKIDENLTLNDGFNTIQYDLIVAYILGHHL